MITFISRVALTLMSSTLLFTSFSAHADDAAQKTTDAKAANNQITIDGQKYDTIYVATCGALQIQANNCKLEATKGAGGLLGSLAAKVSSSDLAKTAADKAAGAAGGQVCGSLQEKADAACKPKG